VNIKELKKKKAKIVMQNHHIVYPRLDHKQEEIIVRIRRAEHFYLTKLQRFKEFTPGFILALKYLILLEEIKNEEKNKEDRRDIYINS